MVLSDKEYLDFYNSKYPVLGAGTFGKVFVLNDEKVIKFFITSLEYNLSEIPENGKVMDDDPFSGEYEVRVQFNFHEINKFLNSNIKNDSIVFPEEMVFYKGKFIAYIMPYIKNSETLCEIQKRDVAEFYSIANKIGLVRKLDNLVRGHLMADNFFPDDLSNKNILYKDGDIFLIDHDERTYKTKDLDFYKYYYNISIMSILLLPLKYGDYCHILNKIESININEIFKMIIYIYMVSVKDKFRVLDEIDDNVTYYNFLSENYITELFMNDFETLTNAIEELLKNDFLDEQKTLNLKKKAI